MAHDAPVPSTGESPPARPRRAYDNTKRDEQAARTRERIITAAIELLRGQSIRDWRGVTVRAVAERAGVSERTVYRHLDSERGLRDAVMHRFEEQLDVDLETIQLEDVAEVTRRTLSHVAEFPARSRPLLDPTLSETHQRQHDALVRAVTEEAGEWPEEERIRAAALLDMLWSVVSYEYLTEDWQLDPDDAIGGLTWVIRLVQDAIANGDRMPD